MPLELSRKQQYLAGVKAGLPVVVGYIPMGIAYAIMARQAGLSVFETVFMSVSNFAGASQMMAAGMFAQGAGMLAMVVTTLILNLRYVIMSTCVFSQMKPAPLPARMLAAFGMTDESFAIFTTGSEAHSGIAYFFGLASSTYVSWVGGSAVGAVAALLLPEILSASLGIAFYAMFLGLLTPSVKGNGRLALLVALTAAVNTLLTLVIPGTWALILSTLACAGAGVFFVNPGEQSAKEPPLKQQPAKEAGHEA